ncbi:hypothetical protein D0856_08025 [Vibrio owensii]|uniref:restriction endonuclease subunit S n=1 Tax=Vibrio owensii TaxID=696485 RepID=UPI000EFBC902|nr:restriction endonuclease subunit S [Vibrio owensii]AYO20039.1 hypothetical protein D0856_08025 [Vibrio owensii]
MSELPKGWIETTFENLIDSITNGIADKQNKECNGIPVSRIETIADETINYARIGYVADYDDVKAKKYALTAGDILFSHINSPLHLGKTAIFDGAQELFHGTNLLRIVIDKRVTLPYYFNYYCKFTRAIGAFSLNAQHAVNQSSLNQKKIKAFSIPLAPLAEQKRIVEKLDEVLAQVDTIKARLDGIPALLKRFRQSVLASAVSGKLTEEWRGEEKLILDEVSNLPQSWQVKAANEVCIKVQSGSTPRNDPFNQGGTVPFLKVYNIVNQKIDFDYKPQFVTTDTHQDKLKRSIAYPGDVLMNIVGPPLGKVAILTDQYPEWNLNQAITLFRANKELLINKYLYFVLCEGALVRDVMPETKGSVGQINISLTQCRESKVPLPPLEEQKEIVRLVDQYFAFADTIEAQVKKAQARVDNLTQSILAKAFRGELVPQDPNDEPADKLLERIALARKEAEALAKAAKKAQSTKSTTKKKVAKSV